MARGRAPRQTPRAGNRPAVCVALRGEQVVFCGGHRRDGHSESTPSSPGPSERPILRCLRGKACGRNGKPESRHIDLSAASLRKDRLEYKGGCPVWIRELAIPHPIEVLRGSSGPATKRVSPSTRAGKILLGFI